MTDKKPLKLKIKKKVEPSNVSTAAQVTVGGITIILKNAKIHAEKVIIKKTR